MKSVCQPHAGVTFNCLHVAGTEFAAASQEAAKYGGKVALGDREVAVTLNRAWRALSLWEKLKLGYGLLRDVSTRTVNTISFIVLCG